MTGFRVVLDYVVCFAKTLCHIDGVNGNETGLCEGYLFKLLQTFSNILGVTGGSVNTYIWIFRRHHYRLLRNSEIHAMCLMSKKQGRSKSFSG